MGGGGDGIDAKMLITIVTFLSFFVVLVAYATPIFAAGDIDSQFKNADVNPKFGFTGAELVESDFFYNDSSPRSQYGYNVTDFAPGDHVGIVPWWIFILYPDADPISVNGTLHNFYDAASGETRTIWCALLRDTVGAANLNYYFLPEGWSGWLFFERWGSGILGQQENSIFDAVSLDDIQNRYDSSRDISICTINLRTQLDVYYKFDYNETNGDLSDHLENDDGYSLTIGEKNAEDYVNSPTKAIGMILGLMTFSKQLTGVGLFDYLLGIVLWVGIIWVFISIFGRLFTL